MVALTPPAGACTTQSWCGSGQVFLIRLLAPFEMSRRQSTARFHATSGKGIPGLMPSEALKPGMLLTLCLKMQLNTPFGALSEGVLRIKDGLEGLPKCRAEVGTAERWGI